MRKFIFQFQGRQVNQQGTFGTFTLTVEDATVEDALLKVYDTHEHISLMSIVECVGDTAIVIKKKNQVMTFKNGKMELFD